jgi:DNA-binding XRE family transcriptional regulator
MELSSRISKVRESLGLNQSEFALKIGASDSSISNWETGKTTPSRMTLARIAEGFGVSLEWLRTGQGEMHPPESRRGSFPTSRTGDVPIVTDTGPGYATGAASPQPEVPMVQVSPEVLATLAAAGVIILADPSTILSLIDRNAKREPIRLRVAIDDDPPDDADAAT